MKMLHEASRDELIEELFKRYEHAIFSGLRTGDLDTKQGNYQVTTRHKGNCVTCAGLAAHSQQTSLDELQDMAAPPEDL